MVQTRLDRQDQSIEEELKRIIKNPKLIEEYNKDRHYDDRIHDEREWVQLKLRLSRATFYRSMKRLGLSVATLKQETKNLDVDKTIDVFELDEFQPVIYNPVFKDSKNEGEFLYSKAENVTKILCLGDFQLGTLKTANGRDDEPVLTVKRYFEKLKEQLTREFFTQKVNHLVIFLLGDLVDGENIYIGQEVIPVQTQAQEMADLIYDLIQWIASFDMESIDIYSVRGNHGRLMKYYHKDSNWDSVIAKMLEMRYDIHHQHEHMLQVQMHYSNEPFQEIKINEWNFLVHHGDFTSGGFDVGKITKKIDKYTHYKYKNIHAVVMGHWHQICMGETYEVQYVINGTTYESEFVQDVIGERESLGMLLLTVGKTKAIQSLTVLDLR